MIEVKRSENRITVKGHAGYAPHGQDVVCAAVSTLLTDFYLSVKELTHDEIKSRFQARKRRRRIWESIKGSNAFGRFLFHWRENDS